MVAKPSPSTSSLGPKTGPDWLEPLISTSYFGPCELHTAESCSAASHKNECNMFCMECAAVGERYSLCTLCVAEHPSHNIIQIRRSSYHDCIRVNEIQRLVDLYNIQTYIINGNKIVLADRPQLKSTKGQIHLCEICDRVLNDPMRFCSLGCKLAGIEKDPHDDTLTMSPRFQPGLLPADSEDSQGSRKKYALDKQLKRQLSTLSRQSSPPLPALREVGAPNSDNESPYRPYKSYRKPTASEERRLDESASPFRSQHRELVKQLSEAFNSGGFLKKKRRAAAHPQLSRASSPVRLATPSSSTSLTPPPTPPSCAQSYRTSFGNKRRKGIPHRAPVC